MALVPADKIKDTLKSIKKIRDLIRSLINNSDDYDDEYMKIKQKKVKN